MAIMRCICRYSTICSTSQIGRVLKTTSGFYTTSDIFSALNCSSTIFQSRESGRFLRPLLSSLLSMILSAVPHFNISLFQSSILGDLDDFQCMVMFLLANSNAKLDSSTINIVLEQCEGQIKLFTVHRTLFPVGKVQTLF